MLLQTLKMSEIDTLLQEEWDGNHWHMSWSQHIRLKESDDKQTFPRLTTKAWQLGDWVHVWIHHGINFTYLWNAGNIKGKGGGGDGDGGSITYIRKLNITVKTNI